MGSWGKSFLRQVSKLEKLAEEPCKKHESKAKRNDIETSMTSGELITKITGGANLVDGKQTWEHAQTSKNDIECMKKCCDAELKAMEKTHLHVAAPFYFERVAILSRKEKNYQQEIDYCEKYMKAIEAFYKKHGTEGRADVRQGPCYARIMKRIPKAKELLAKSR